MVKNCPGCKFAPGSFTKRIIIQTQSEVQDDTGAMTTTWATFATVWAKVSPVHGNEALIAQRVDAVDVYNITIRFMNGITEKMRISYANRIDRKSVV